jgi:hypothetical protein
LHLDERSIRRIDRHVLRPLPRCIRIAEAIDRLKGVEVGFERETERATAGDERSQGDIIRIEHVLAGDEPDLGVIINADCDLAHGRLDGVVTYLPLYTFRQYLTRFWAPGHVTEAFRNATQKVLELSGDVAAEADGLHDWIRTDGAAAVSASLIKAGGLKRAPAAQMEREVGRIAIALDENATSYERFSRLCAVEPDPAGHARKQIIAAKKAMGDGHFFISDLVDHDELGFVVRMRRILSIAEDRCFRSVAEQKSTTPGLETTAVRVGRLTPLYRIKVLQVFAQQFTRIGLSDDVTALSGMAIDDLVATAVGDRA